jgi:hypothetical protein
LSGQPDMGGYVAGLELASQWLRCVALLGKFQVSKTRH